jgi:teichuronic acid biosynthesis glycosyltransferase TuaC
MNRGLICIEERLRKNAMLRVLTISTLFPDRARPGFGRFVERQTLKLAAQAEIAVEIVAPIGLPPWPFSRLGRYRPLAGLPGVEDRNGLRVHRPPFPILPLVGAGRSARAMAKALLPVLARIREDFAFDIIDAEFFWPDGVAAVRLGAALGVPVSIKARGSDIDHWSRHAQAGPQMLEAARAADGLLAVSEALRQRMIAFGMPAEKIAVHHTGIDAELFKPRVRAEAKAALGIEGPLIASVGALIPLKRQGLVLEALARLPEAQLLLIGDGPDRASLERLAARLGVAGRVHFLGALAHEALPPLLAAADLLLHASEREGLANVWIEALACGTPVVIAETEAAHEVVDRPEAGRIVERDPEALAQGARAILASPPAPEKVRASALRFGWERNGRELFDHLMRLKRG